VLGEMAGTTPAPEFDPDDECDRKRLPADSAESVSSP
jgi:hypothetical protein